MGVEFRNNEATFNEMAEDGDFTDSDLVITSGIFFARYTGFSGRSVKTVLVVQQTDIVLVRLSRRRGNVVS
ncbi:hypothetical protein ACFX12_018247 [Malus domestica]